MKLNRKTTPKPKITESHKKSVLKKYIGIVLKEMKLKGKHSIKESYSGYENEDTYKAALYLENEEKLYRKYESQIGSITAEMAKELFKKLQIYNMVGYKEVNQKNVNWEEVAEDLNGL